MTLYPKVYVKPNPWRHLLAWMFRRKVHADDVVPKRWIEEAHRSADEWKNNYYEVKGYLEQLAREHHPVVRDAEKYTGQIGASVLDLACAECAYGWPCPTWSLATRNDLEPIRIVLKQKKPEATRDSAA